MRQPVDDESLWLGVRDGDSRAFEVLFDRYADLIYNVAFRRTGSWDVAEELVGAVLLEAWRQRHDVELRDGSLKPWLVGVTVNLTSRHWRHVDRSRRAHLRLVGDETHQVDHAVEVADRIDAERQMATILRSLEVLPTDQRQVLELWAFERLSYDEIASVLEIPIGTVRSRLHRARAFLQNEIGTRRRYRASTDSTTSGAATAGHADEEGVST